MAGWIISGETAANFNVHNNSGDRTYAVGEICPTVKYDETYCYIDDNTYHYTVALEGLEKASENPVVDVKVKKQYQGSSCSDDCLTMWFNDNGTNTSFPHILPEENSEDGFRENLVSKNVDECRQLLVRETTATTMQFGTELLSERNTYIDSGFPRIASDPYEWRVSTENPSIKYKKGSSYDGHKVKYLIGNGGGGEKIELTVPTQYFSPRKNSTGNVVSNLSEIYFPHNRNNGNGYGYVKTIADEAFIGNNTLSAVTFGGVESIGKWAFSECMELKMVDMGHTPCNYYNLKDIGASAFTVTKLEKVEVVAKSGGELKVGNRAFGANPQLTKFRLKLLGEALLGDEVLYDCTGLTEVEIKGTDKLKAINTTGTAAGPFANIGSTPKLVIDNSSIVFTDDAKKCLTPFKNVEIPSSSKVIDTLDKAFEAQDAGIKFKVSSYLLGGYTNKYGGGRTAWQFEALQ